MRQVRFPALATVTVTGGSPGRGRLRLSAISNTPDHDDDTAVRLPMSDGDHEVVEGRQRLAQDGRTSTAVDRLSNGRAVAADCTSNVDDVMRRRDEEAEVQALLRDLGVEPSPVSK